MTRQQRRREFNLVQQRIILTVLSIVPLRVVFAM